MLESGGDRRCALETMTLKARADDEGIVRLEIPTQLANRELEIVLVMQPVEGALLDDMGYPIGYFEATYGSFADEPLECHQGKSSK